MAENKAQKGKPESEPDTPGQVSATYDPSTAEVDRGRVQGLGAGQKEIDRQRDPTRTASAEQYGRDDQE